MVYPGRLVMSLQVSVQLSLYNYIWLLFYFISDASEQLSDVTTEQVSDTANAATETEDITVTSFKLKGEVCHTPKDASTNVLDFLNRSDIQKRQSTAQIPYFTPGSYLSVTRADPYSPSGVTRFVGICIARRKNGIGSTFILRNVINGMGVEMMFELYSPTLREIKVLKLERRRRAKLYYLRDKPLKFSTVNEKMEPVDSNGRVLVYKRKRGDPA